MKICYIAKDFSAASLAIIDKAHEIITDYQAQGFDLTLRQLYYQFVSRGLIPNRQSEYKRLGTIINDARLAGLISWLAITDRTRNLVAPTCWESPAEILDAAASGYHVDYWEDQEYRPEVWIEKDALTGVISGVCDELDVPYFSCRGYTSQSEMWGAAQRLVRQAEAGHGYIPIIFHLGDHDPSGIDMTRDIVDRLNLFSENAIDIERIALSMDQIQEYDPPPNPTKLTDSRAAQYVKLYGDNSWELDALEPSVIAALIREAVGRIRDVDCWDQTEAREEEHKRMLRESSEEIKERLREYEPEA